MTAKIPDRIRSHLKSADNILEEIHNDLDHIADENNLEEDTEELLRENAYRIRVARQHIYPFCRS